MVMTTEGLKVRSGNRIAVEFGGQEVGLLQDIRCSDDYAPEPASGIGDIHVKEYVPTMARHTINASQAVLNTGSLRGAGATPVNGDSVLEGMMFDIAIYDKGAQGTGGLLRKYIDCSFANGDIEVRKHAIVITNATFYALDAGGGAA